MSRDDGARSLHLLGIGGSGLASLAACLLERGDRVSGCDGKDGAVIGLLRARGAAIDLRHDAGHLPERCDALVHTAAVAADHPELRAAAARGIPVRKYARFLGEETRGRRCYAVAGTHGKTTTTALLAEILDAAGADPSAVVGGFPASWPLPGRAGSGAPFVVEACEYDRSFQNFAPHVAVVTNVEPDHLDYFGDEAAIVRAFAEFLARVEPGGCAILHESAAAALAGAAPGALVVGESDGAGARLERDAEVEGRARGRLRLPGSDPVELRPALLGEHNLTNSALATAAALRAGVAPAVIERAVAAYRGVRRRLEPVGERGGVAFVSDYAHHPTEIRSVRRALRAGHPGRRILVVFQPHQASRTRAFRDGFAAELAQFDEVIVPNIFSVREAPEGVEHETVELLTAVRAHGRPALRTGGLAGVFAAVEQVARAGDVVVLMGAGDIDDLAELLRAAAPPPIAAGIAPAPGAGEDARVARA